MYIAVTNPPPVPDPQGGPVDFARRNSLVSNGPPSISMRARTISPARALLSRVRPTLCGGGTAGCISRNKRQILYVAIMALTAGAIGTALRVTIDENIDEHLKDSYCWGSVACNLSAFLLTAVASISAGCRSGTDNDLPDIDDMV